jgi:D-threo-aldose 1-dehydrogenase
MRQNPLDRLADASGGPGLGVGGAPLGNLYSAVDEDSAQQTLQRAWALGLRYYDTAPLYGQGLSEQRLGQALRGRERASYQVSTKVGRVLCPDAQAPHEQAGYVGGLPFTVHFDYSADGVQRALEGSLGRLGLEHIDIAYIHDIDRRTHGADQPRRFAEAMDGAYPALARLRSQGVIGAIGLGVNEWEVCRDALAHGDFDGFMLAGRYTLLDTSAQDVLLPLCASRGVRLVLAGVYNSGILATGAVLGARYDYLPADEALRARVRRIEAVCADFQVPLRAAALHFALQCPQAAAVVVGGRTPAEIEDSVAMARQPVPPALWDALRTQGLLAPAGQLTEQANP